MIILLFDWSSVSFIGKLDCNSWLLELFSKYFWQLFFYLTCRGYVVYIMFDICYTFVIYSSLSITSSQDVFDRKSYQGRKFAKRIGPWEDVIFMYENTINIRRSILWMCEESEDWLWSDIVLEVGHKSKGEVRQGGRLALLDDHWGSWWPWWWWAWWSWSW